MDRATAELYTRYAPALVRKARRMLQSEEDASDVVQSLFIDLMQKGRTDASLPYLYRSVTNRCLDLIRDRSNRARLLEQQSRALRGPARVRCDDEVVGVDMLAKLADRLDEGTLEVLVCRFVDDMQQDEIADILGTSRKTVVRRLARIREQVAALLAEEGRSP